MKSKAKRNTALGDMQADSGDDGFARAKDLSKILEKNKKINSDALKNFLAKNELALN